MIGYKFYPTADEQLDAIWQYTKMTWGEKQADTYIRGLYLHLEQLCREQVRWCRLPFTSAKISTELYCSRYKKHILFFTLLSDGHIGVISILHEKMDFLARLEDDFDKINF